MARKPNPIVQDKALKHVLDTSFEYAQLLKPRDDINQEIYKEYSTFKADRVNPWSPGFKVNKIFETVEKVVPRIIARNPKWIVTPGKPGVDMDNVSAIQDYLNYIFDEYNLDERFEAWAKSMIVYGYSHAKIRYKYERARVSRTEMVEEINEETGEPVFNEQGEPMMIEEVVEVTEDVTGEYPTIDVLSWADVLFDPRYQAADEVPAVITNQYRVRATDIVKMTDRYFNLDKIKQLNQIQATKPSTDEMRKAVETIAGISSQVTPELDFNNLKLTTYYGDFSPTGEVDDVQLYEITVANNVLLIGFQQL